MDNLCHTLVGAALGEAGLKHRARHGNAVLMVAANLPDIDVLGFASGVPAVAIRRGWTHGVLAWAVLPIAFAGIVLAIERIRSRGQGSPPRAPSSFGSLLLLSVLGIVIHVLMDWLNNYGVRLLMPFSSRWFYGDAVFIVDVWLWLVLGLGVWLARRSARPSAARLALTVSLIYVAGMVWSAMAARQHVVDAWGAGKRVGAGSPPPHGSAPRALMVGPVPVTPFSGAIIVDAGDVYHTGDFRWLPARTAFSPNTTPRLDAHPAVGRARDHPDIRAVLSWARFPYYELEQVTEGVRVTVRDMRFGSRVGQVSVVVPNE
jgi:inner membrane protein